VKLGIVDKDEETLRALRLRHWVSSRAPLCESDDGGGSLRRLCSTCSTVRLRTFLRAQLMHRCFPAEEMPAPAIRYTVIAVNLIVVFQLCNWALLLRFALMDHSDEYQLVSFIVASKSYHFVVYGLVQLAQDIAMYFNCVLKDVGNHHPCSMTAPGKETGYWFDFLMECIRLLCVWYAFHRLAKAKGGAQQAYELERERLGVQEGSRTAEQLRRLLVPNEQSGNERGSVMRYLLIYDILVYSGCLAFGLINLAIHMITLDCSEQGVDCRAFLKPNELFGLVGDSLLSDWRLWMTLDFTQTCYSLLLFPFALLSLQPFMKYFTHARPTGFDRAGRLCLSLNSLEILERAQMQGVEQVEEKAAQRIQGTWQEKQRRQRDEFTRKRGLDA